MLGWSEGGEKPSDTEESQGYSPKIPFPGKLMQITKQFTLEEFQPYLYL